MTRIKSDEFEQPFHPIGLPSRIAKREQFSFRSRYRDSLLFSGFPINRATKQAKDETFRALSIDIISETSV
jgi:hypothetical protein